MDGLHRPSGATVKRNPWNLFMSLWQLPVQQQHKCAFVRVHVHNIRALVHARNRQGEATSDNQEEEKDKGWRDHSDTKTDGGWRDKVRVGEKNESKRKKRREKRYLFWRPPSPPRSSEKFLRFPQHQLNHREKKKSPMSTDRREREAEGDGEGGREGGGRQTERERREDREWQSSSLQPSSSHGH